MLCKSKTWYDDSNFLCFCLTAGVWATKLGEMAGVNVPLIAMHHAYVVTERIEGIQVISTSIYIDKYMEKQSF